MKAEGAARNSDKDFLRFLYISLGSLSELETQLIISEKLGYCNLNGVYNELEEIRKMIIGLIKYLDKKVKP